MAPLPIPGTTRLVLDFVSNANGFGSFAIEGFYDRNTEIGQPPRIPDLVYEPFPDTLNADQQATLRSLVVHLVGESAENTAADTPGNLEAASRVQAGRRLLRMEVMMPNMAHNPGTI
jgi:hypothetical protein